ncbi:MAG TPA: TMEM175 family protein, partial [Micropruina sp.]|nr:TMEM175 family protein [Micropruina sp.]
MTGNTPAASNRPRVPPAERLVFFTDAVVAIAMTLLILPLMESIGDAPDEGDTLHWLGAHRSQLVSFVLSFVIISVFWRAHHRLFEHVATVTQGLFVLDFCWMFTVVWLPIATALTGAM